MIQDERLEAIKNILRSKKIVSSNELCELLFCSKSTIRRDLLQMETAGIVRRTRGGVTLAADRAVELPIRFRRNKNQDKKEAIARQAKRYLENDLLMFLDASTTVRAIVPHIIALDSASIVTNSLSIAGELGQYSHLQVLIPGGRIYAGHDAILGMQTLDSLRDFAFDLAFFSCKSLDAKGAYEAEYEQALVKKNMLRQAKLAVLLCDTSKIGQSSLYHFATQNEFSEIITD